MGRRILLIEHYEVEASALGVVSAVAGPVARGGKEPAGAAFHETVLRQRGLLGEGTSMGVWVARGRGAWRR
jgi:hypothetical protein